MYMNILIKNIVWTILLNFLFINFSCVGNNKGKVNSVNNESKKDQDNEVIISKNTSIAQNNKNDSIRYISHEVAEQNLDTINIKNYGAIGNGLNDDGNSIQKAINELKENQVLFIPKGTYLIKRTLNFDKKNVKVVGEGISSFFQYKWGKYSKTKKLLYGFHLRNASNITFSNFRIDGGAKNYKQIILDDNNKQTWDVDGAYHLFFIQPKSDYSVNNITFEKLSLSNSFFDAIHSYARPADPGPKNKSKDIFINNCSFSNIGSHGVGLGLVSNLIVERSKFENVGLMKVLNSGFGSGMAVDASGGSENVTIRNNVVSGAGAGFKCETHENNGGKYLTSKNITISSNVIKNLYTGKDYEIFYGIKANGDNVKVLGNKIESFYHGILVGKNAKNTTITGNTISVTGLGATGIRVDKNLGFHILRNNQIIKSKSQGILIANSSNVDVLENIIIESGSDNIRIAGGEYIKLINNICADAGNVNISIAPVKGMSIGNIEVRDNVCYNLDGSSKPTEKRLLISNINHAQISNNDLLNSSNINSFIDSKGTFKVQFADKKPSSGNFVKGNKILKKRSSNNLSTDNVLGWVCIESGNPGKWKTIQLDI